MKITPIRLYLPGYTRTGENDRVRDIEMSVFASSRDQALELASEAIRHDHGAIKDTETAERKTAVQLEDGRIYLTKSATPLTVKRTQCPPRKAQETYVVTMPDGTAKR